jgi:hypothetical protein
VLTFFSKVNLQLGSRINLPAWQPYYDSNNDASTAYGCVLAVFSQQFPST